MELCTGNTTIDADSKRRNCSPGTSVRRRQAWKGARCCIAMESIGMEQCLGKYLHRFLIFFDLFFTVVSSASETENELSNHTLAEESNNNDKLNELTEHENITIIETKAIKEIDIEEDELSNETQEKHLTLKSLSEEIKKNEQ